MVIAYHLIWTLYGWWLPNDLRGGMSQTIRNDIIGEMGELHHGRKRVQPSSREIREFYEEAAGKLRHELCTMNEEERAIAAACFAEVIAKYGYTCYACAIMLDHVHILIRKHRDLAEDMIAHLQDVSRLRFRADGIRSAIHPVWGGPGWKVFLDTPNDVWRTIQYIEDNPIQIGLPAQEWSFVTEYNNWPLHKK